MSNWSIDGKIVTCWKCRQALNFFDSDEDAVNLAVHPYRFQHKQCPSSTSNKCPQCGFPEHESGECPYARPKGEKYDYVEAVLIPVAEPSLSLLVVDFGDSCVVKVEKGDGLEAVSYLPGIRLNDISAYINRSFSELCVAIDAHFAENKPLPRIEYHQISTKFYDRHGVNGYDVYYKGKQANDSDVYDATISENAYSAINELARQAGATRDLEVYEPKGKWVQLLGGIGDHSFNDVVDVAIWRFTR